MKKYLFVTIFFVFISIFFISCENKNDIKNNISEITKIYFQGGNENGDLKCSICVGQRENPYKVDGYHNKTCDFSLVSLKGMDYFSDQIKIKLIINDIPQELVLFYNPVNNIYMNDLGYTLRGNDSIKIEVMEESFTVYSLSKDFKINYNDAIKIATKELSKEIEELYDKKTFLGECYLKIYTNWNGDELFWYFSIETRENKTISLILSVDNGKIVAKN